MKTPPFIPAHSPPVPRWWKGVVWVVYLLAIAAAATITLAGTDEGGHTYIEYGWPWRFGIVRWHESWSRFAFFQAPIGEHRRAFLGDVAVLLVTLASLELVRRWAVRRRPRISLRTAAAAVTLLCILLGYGVMRYRRGERLVQLRDQLFAARCSFFVHEYPPEWLQRLTGRSYLSTKLFAGHTGDIDIYGGCDLPVVQAALSELSQLDEICVHDDGSFDLYAEGIVREALEEMNRADLAVLMRHPQFRGIRTLTLYSLDNNDAALAEIKNYAQLEDLTLVSFLDAPDAAAEHLAGCPRLRTLTFYGTSPITPACIPALKRIPNLEELKLEYGHLRQRDLDAFRAQLPHVKVIGNAEE